MSWRRTQRSRYKPVWLPLRRKHYRQSCATKRLHAKFSPVGRQLLTALDNVRRAPFVLSIDTGRWYQRGPEQLAFAVKGAHGQLVLELAKLTRLPPGRGEPYYRTPWGEVKRHSDQYQQHIRPFRYNLSDSTHADAFRELIHHVCAYTAGHGHREAFSWLYTLAIGESRTLYTRPLRGLSWWNPEQGRQEPVQGYESVEIVCEPGERPRRPWALADPDHPSYEAEHDWWLKWQSLQTKRHSFRVRRYWEPSAGTEEPAWYLNDAHELMIPLEAAERIARLLPPWWERVEEQVRARATPLRRPIPRLRMAGDINTAAENEAKPKKEIPLPYCEPWQINWDEKVFTTCVRKHLIKEACRFEPEHGLFLSQR